MDKIRKFLSHLIQTGELKELLIVWPQLSLIVFQVAEQLSTPYLATAVLLSISVLNRKLFCWSHIEKLIILFRYSNLPRRILRSRKLLHIENNGDCCWQFNSSPKFRGDLEYAKIGFSGLPKRSPKSIRRVLCDIVRTQLNRTWQNWKFV